MSIKLFGSMMIALSATIGIATLGILFIGSFLGGITLLTALLLAIILILFQWAIAPKIISITFGLIPAEKAGYRWLVDLVRDLARKAGMKKVPTVYISPSGMANAFAFGNAISGKKVAVTRGLLEILNEEEIKAVIGHELGHIRHKDIEIMMALSVLPAVFYLFARWLYYAGFFGGFYRDERGSERAVLFILAMISFIIYIVLSLFMLWFSRLREYYADQHSAEVVEHGNVKLARALAKLQYANSMIVRKKVPEKSVIAFKALMISDPETSDKIPLGVHDIDDLVYRIAQKKVTLSERLMELFMTHPLPPKRIRRLLSLSS